MKPINLTNNNLFLVFLNDKGEKEAFPIESKHSSLEKGEVIFHIPADKSNKILAFNNKSFWINNIQNGIESTLYSGKFDSAENYESYKKEKEKETVALESKKQEIINIATEIQNKETIVSSVDTNNSNNTSTQTKIINPYLVNEKNIEKMVNKSIISIKEKTPKSEIDKPKLKSEKMTSDLILENKKIKIS